MPIAGMTRFRQWAFSAAQSAHGTAATPTRAFPYRGTPTVDPNWTDVDDVDVGSIDTILSPYRTQTDTTVTLEGPLDYNNIPRSMAAAVRGGVTATANTWVHQSLSTTATTLDEFSAQWGDDYGTDDIRFRDGVIEKLEFTFDEGLGPWRVSEQWYFGFVSPNTTRQANQPIPSNMNLVFGADTAVYIDNTGAGIGSTQISSALHSARVTITNTIDKKRFADGSNSRFAVNSYSLAGRDIEVELTFAKNDSILGFPTSELRNWLSSTPVTRFLELKAISPEIATGSTPYSWSQRFALNWRMKGDGELGGNSTVTLTGKGRFDNQIGYAYRSATVCSRTTLP